MTVGLDDPYEQFWATARDTTSVLTPSEEQTVVKIQRTGTNATEAGVAMALAAAFLLYRRHMARRIKESAKPDINALQALMGAVYVAFLPSWVRMTVPAIISGYQQGMETNIPAERLYEMANEYSAQLGQQIHQVSADALLSGFQAQVNRKVAKELALGNVLDAFGVPPRAMNALVTTWSSESPKVYTDRVPTVTPQTRAKSQIADELMRRSRLIGENEAWATKNHAKLISWLYAQREGVIPETATRVWKTAKDERVCPVCGPLHKQEALLSEQFETRNGPVWAPPLHPRCRCELVLSMNTVEAEIAKARPGDPYNRDKDGQFSAVERRAAKRPNDQMAVQAAPAPKQEAQQEVDPRHYTLWTHAMKVYAQAGYQDVADTVREMGPDNYWVWAQNERRQRQMRIEQLKANARRGSLVRQVKEDKPAELKRNEVPAEQLKRVEAPKRIEQAQRKEQTLQRNSKAAEQMRIWRVQNEYAQQELKRTRPDQPDVERMKYVDNEEGNYIKLPDQKMIYLVQGPEDVYAREDDVVVTSGEEWVTDDVQDADREMRTPLNRALGDYWEAAKRDITRRYYTKEFRNSFWQDPDTGMEWYISEHEYNQALDWIIEGAWDNDSTITLFAQEPGVTGLRRREIRAADLADHLNLDEVVHKYRPIIFATDWLNTDEGTLYPGVQGSSVNPGRWRVRSSYGMHGVQSDAPYQMWYLEPDQHYGQDDRYEEEED